METNEKKTDAKDWWKIIAFLVIGILIGIFFGMKVLSAIELDLNKTQACNLLNYSGTQCNSFWCVSGLKGNWTADEICVLGYNSTNQTNQTNTTYLNEGLVRNISRNETLKIVDEKKLVNESTLITTKNSILDGEENRTGNFIENKIDELLGDYDSRIKQPIEPWVIIVVFLILGIVVVAIMYFKSKNNPKEDEGNYDLTPRYTPRGPYKSSPQDVSYYGPPSVEQVKEFERTGKPPVAEKEGELE
jgi:H+/Cl- antiporter ClcA